METGLIGCFLENIDSETGGSPMLFRFKGSDESNFLAETAETLVGGAGMLPAEEAEPLRFSDRVRCEKVRQKILSFCIFEKEGDSCMIP